MRVQVVNRDTLFPETLHTFCRTFVFFWNFSSRSDLRFGFISSTLCIWLDFLRGPLQLPPGVRRRG